MARGLTMSLDGFVADANGGIERLYTDLTDLQDSAYMNSAVDRTGAVILGRKTFAMGEPASRMPMSAVMSFRFPSSC